MQLEARKRFRCKIFVVDIYEVKIKFLTQERPNCIIHNCDKIVYLSKIRLPK